MQPSVVSSLPAAMQGLTTASRRASSPTRSRSGRAGLKLVSPASFPHSRLSSSTSSPNLSSFERTTTNGSSASSLWSDASSDSETATTPITDTQSDIAISTEELDVKEVAEVDLTKTRNQHASTTLVTQDPEVLREAVGDGENGRQLIQKYCCGGGCCFLNAPAPVPASAAFTPVSLPSNAAFQSLNLKLPGLAVDTELTNMAEYPVKTPSFSSLAAVDKTSHKSTVGSHPPTFVQPHPPYSVFSAPLYHARELTKPGAEKRTFHFDIDVTDYPQELDGVDFKVGGAVGVAPANESAIVDEVFDLLGVPRYLRDRPTLLKTNHGRWPTVWGEEQERELVTTRREILSWCTDIQSYPPTKNLFRVLGDHATDPSEQKILHYLASAQGQAAFCELRTGPHLSLIQLLHAFPSSKPPFADLVACLSQLMPRFYSLSNDPHVSSEREGLAGRRLIEIAVTVHEKSHWDGEKKATGVGSGFLERLALQFIEAEKRGEHLDLRIPLFRGLMANPLSKQFSATEGPMMLIGAGVGMAPFRGFILNRLKNANCASKIWLVQGVRDSQVDELYSGELGQYESQIKRVVQSRVAKKKTHAGHVRADLKHCSSENDISLLRKDLRSHGTTPLHDSPGSPTSDDEGKTRWKASSDPDLESKYVQDEVRQQADVVWEIISSADGRIFVCGSSKGMGEGVEQALRDVVMQKKSMSPEAAANFWNEMKSSGKYVAETW